ncbi:MAG TPA: lipase maturation factor family protein [Terriglobia bacterium]|nr:lipase maturation factor family protein [Terriglobia bacterium]
MLHRLSTLFHYLFGSVAPSKRSHLLPRWLWLRALGLIFFSAFYSLLFQVRGLIGPEGILPASRYLSALHEQAGARAYWYVPSFLWLSSGNHALMAISWVGLIASLMLVLNFWPRGMIAVCLLMYLSFVTAAQEFSSYQSDGMLLEAAFISLFFAPRGWRPGWGDHQPPSRASLFLLRWEWFRIYFESGVVKLVSHDLQWRNLSALDHYYENGPLPDWIGWYAQQLPHRFQSSIALATLVIELGLVWMLFLPRRFRLLCFLIVTPFQIGIILTANLAFLNYLVLCLGLLLLEDEVLGLPLRGLRRLFLGFGEPSAADLTQVAESPAATNGREPATQFPVRLSRFRALLQRAPLFSCALVLSWIFYNTTALLLLMILPALPLPTSPIMLLEPFRISNQYGLFAVMTRARYEIEFQGSNDGQTWVAYPFRYKPQNPRQAPRLYAPYQPRFDWNLWFASLGGWREYPFVVRTEVQLLRGSPSVLSLFAGNPFPGKPPRQVRAVLWQYWFTDLNVKRKEGLWWRRKLLGLYAPTLEFTPDGSVGAVEMPDTESIPPP